MAFSKVMWLPYSYISRIANLVLQRLWHNMHLILNTYYLVVGIACVLESYLISSGLWKEYKAFNSSKVKYLAIVVDSEEAYLTSRIVKLVSWLEALGVKHICLYDAEGVMKKSKEAIVEKLNKVTILEGAAEKDKLVSQNSMTLEFASFSDGKEAVAKAANLLLGTYMKLAELGGDQEEKIFTEPYMAEALKATGCNVIEPDLMLVYGPVRCHHGFPAWRIRYTEIVHMGSLAEMKYGSLIKVIYEFTMVRQNYGK
ncbi:hypothetical protein TIFTF001_006046 [Ficus carica]|uniref:ditrans,polycis-polyprenyl diphosphate synthase [(2E,6E)-farnesyldiphosphate specific] n=1 Tax=Ficus carica TaxID=3494 RepID=A0AA87ZM04_FICCA|nr:hypothetical protein TIFTF001_006046 [Ficus carica]